MFTKKELVCMGIAVIEGVAITGTLLLAQKTNNKRLMKIFGTTNADEIMKKWSKEDIQKACKNQ